MVRSFGRRRLDQPELNVARLAARQAYEQAGPGPQDMDVAKVHDATAMGEIMQVEDLGFVAPGEGGPVNPSGGLESRGHPLGATGLAQVYELTTQLRGEAGARQVPGAQSAAL